MGMTNNNTVTIFDRAYYTIHTNAKTSCYKCGKPYEDGDEIYHKRSNNKRSYHLKCWEKTLN